MNKSKIEQQHKKSLNVLINEIKMIINGITM